MSDLVVAKFNPNQPRDSDGEWSDGIPGPAGDPLKLAARIRLGPGERFGGSAKVADVRNDLALVMARIDGPSGSVVRVGQVPTEDIASWRAADKGGTAELPLGAARQFRDTVAAQAAAGKKSVAEHRAALRAAHKAGVPDDQLPDPEADLGGGVIKGDRWGDVHWRLTREEGPEYEASGEVIGMGGEWVLSVGVVTASTPSGADHFLKITSPAQVRQLDTAITGLTAAGPVTASITRTRGGLMAELLGVELARPGTWQLSSGKRDFTAAMLRDAADFHAAAGGQRIPLGFGHMDARFDGEPAFGWLSNVRYAEDAAGPVLLGDLTDLDDWVAAAAPARWPHRSIEGVMGVEFGGREYGLVLTRLALLGSTPPGIPALKSLSDLRQLVSAAAAASGAEWIAAAAPEAATPETSPPGAVHPSDRKGAPGMPDAAKLRDALGLEPGASDDEVKASLATAGLVASQPEPRPAPEPTPQPEPQPEPGKQPDLVSASTAQPGTLVVASSVWEETQKTIKNLTSFVDKTKREERDTVIAKAVEDGKFTPAQKPHFARLWDTDPDSTRNLIDNLTKNSALAVAASGYNSDSDESIDREYAHLFPPKAGGRRG